MFFPQFIGSLMIQKAQAVLKGQKLPAITPAPIVEVTTPLAKAWLAGTAKPPAALSASIMQKLTAAQPASARSSAHSPGCPALRATPGAATWRRSPPTPDLFIAVANGRMLRSLPSSPAGKRQRARRVRR